MWFKKEISLNKISMWHQKPVKSFAILLNNSTILQLGNSTLKIPILMKFTKIENHYPKIQLQRKM